MSSPQCHKVDDYIDVLWRSTTHNSHRGTSGGVKPKTPKESGTPLFALIVGINTYALEKLTLRGAIADADAIQGYLENELAVPKSRIQNLRNSQATRAAIITELESLAHNDLIQPDDPILIYYAGHGGEATAPAGWAAGGSDNKIQMLIPYDYRIALSEGNYIQAIPDRTIGILLTRLAEAKGDNITVIFDCCHSGSGTRLDEDILLARGIRGFTISDPIPADLDVDLWSTSYQAGEDRGGKIPHSFLHSGLRSHVLLAACGVKEQAKEERGRGVFTRALLQLLTAINVETITYSDVLRRIPALPEQNPQCEGVNKARILFKGGVPSRGRLFYKVRKDKNNTKYYILEAGAAHGIRKDAAFDVYPTDAHSQHTSPHAPTSMIARETLAFTSILELDKPNSSSTFVDIGYAVQTRAGEEEDLRLHIHLDSIKAFTPILQLLGHDMSSDSSFGSTLRRISLLSREKAEYEMQIKDDRVFLTTLNPQVNQFGLYQLPENVKLAYPQVTRLLSALAHYQKHLRRNYNSPALQKLIEIKFTRLETREANDSLDALGETPVGENLNKGGTVHIPIDPIQSGSDLYGIEIVNNSPLNLYASVFYFDNSNLSIESYYECCTSNSSHIPDFCLRKKSSGGMRSSLTSGYGSSGSQPHEYFLNEDQQVDVGFLKVYLTTTPVDFSHVAQESPFNSELEEDNDGGLRAGGLKKIDHSGPDVWTSMLVTMVQTRTPSNVQISSSLRQGLVGTMTNA